MIVGVVLASWAAMLCSAEAGADCQALLSYFLDSDTSREPKKYIFS